MYAGEAEKSFFLMAVQCLNPPLPSSLMAVWTLAVGKLVLFSLMALSVKKTFLGFPYFYSQNQTKNLKFEYPIRQGNKCPITHNICLCFRSS